MTNNNTTATLLNTFRAWAGSIDEHGLAAATVTDTYIEYPADSPMGDWHAAIWATEETTPGFAALIYEGMGGTYQPISEPGRSVHAYRRTF